MNDFQMMALSNDTMAQRRAEADRSRLAHSGRTEPVSRLHGSDSRHQWDPRVALSGFFRRFATL